MKKYFYKILRAIQYMTRGHHCIFELDYSKYSEGQIIGKIKCMHSHCNRERYIGKTLSEFLTNK